ncbi:MAG: bifunctional molybdenum cofactor biosynthesis protein MoaC/MoaB [Chitinophagaceae bacterium]|nr:bifunctional molybdenum cofactor biosynthesis protein MoaC/MoaB [Chitinophagaceae bacterium]
MVNITHKSNSLRIAVAGVSVQMSSELTIQAIVNKQVPKGDVFAFAKVAALFAIKKTSDMIPDCHPLPIEFSDVYFKINGLTIEITVEVHTVYKTGVEVEAMHGASVAALTLYDMLKPIDKQIEIQHLRLLHKEGGKTSYQLKRTEIIKAAVIVCSDTVYQKMADDMAGLAVIEKLKSFNIEVPDYRIIPDEALAIREQVSAHANNQVQLLFFIGGTGASPRDITPDIIKPLLDKELTGIMEQARRYGQDRMPYAMLSRSVAGLIGNTLVMTLPGSTKAATEYIDALFPQSLHVLDMVKGSKH